jgi:integrase
VADGDQGTQRDAADYAPAVPPDRHGASVPVLGKVRLDKLAPRDVQRLLSTRREAVPPATLVKIHAVLRVALADAERLDLFPRNVARAVKGPSLGHEERQALTVEEARAFLAAVESERLEAVSVLGLTMGLRRGEVLGLRWDDIDFEARVLDVRRALQRVDGALRLVETKTRASRRPLPIPAMSLRAPERRPGRRPNASRPARHGRTATSSSRPPSGLHWNRGTSTAGSSSYAGAPNCPGCGCTTSDRAAQRSSWPMASTHAR